MSRGLPVSSNSSHEIRLTDWEKLLADAESSSPGKSNSLLDHGSFLLDATLDIHHLIADRFP